MKTKLLSVLFLLSFTLSFALASESSTNINQSTEVDDVPLAPERLFQASVSQHSVALIFENHNDPRYVNEFEIYQDDVLIATARFRRSTLTYQTNLLYTVTNLTPGTSYEFKVRAKDVSGNFSDFSETLTVSTSEADVEAPTAPTQLRANNVTRTSINLSWLRSTDNVSVGLYEIYLNGEKIADSYYTSFIARDLEAGTSYEFKVRAKDISGNFSDFSETLTVSTSQGDIEAPTTPTQLRSNNVTRTSISLSWLRSTDNVRVASYEIYLDGEKVADSYYTVYQARNLEAGTSYEFKVRAKDISGNLSDFSETLTVTTSPSTPQQPGSSNTALNIYPNPVVDILNIELNSTNNNIKYSIYNSWQRTVVYNRTLIDNKINVSNLSAGMYYLVVQDNANRYMKTFYKN